MKTTLVVVLVMLGCRAAARAAPAFDPLTALDQYNVVWATPSEHAHGAMPLGNGEVGINAWVESRPPSRPIFEPPNNVPVAANPCAKDGIHGIAESVGTVAFQAGAHAISVRYFQGVGGEGLRLDWMVPGARFEEIPPSAFAHKE